jgi:hypothetical protein
LHGDALLNAAAEDAVRQWKYRPVLVEDRPGSVVLSVRWLSKIARSRPSMSLQHLLKSAIVGIAVAGLVLVLGVAGEVTWLALGLPGVHRTGGAPATAISVETTNFDVRTVSESHAYVSIVPTYALAGAGLIVGFWRVYRRRPT